MGKPRKIFVSVLGTGFYEVCRYEGLKPTRFIQQATLEWLKAEEWTENDRILIFTTEASKKQNWNFNGKRAKFNGMPEVEYVGLKCVLDNMNLAAKVEAVDIPEGKNEQEMWNVFGRIYDKLENNDLLYFDLTHAFRYLPMLVLVLGQYARHLKKVTIKSVTYGNYEARGGNSDVAPIADLMPLVTLLDYTQAAADFGEYGRVSKLLFSFKGADFDNLAKQLKRFEQDVATCRGRELMNGKTVASAKKSLAAIMASDKAIKPVKELLRSVQKKLEPFEEGKRFQNLRGVVKWCEDYAMVQQAFTLCQEGLVTLACERIENPLTGDKERTALRQLRDVVSAVLAVDKEVMTDESMWKRDLLLDKNLSRKLFAMDGIVRIRKNYNNLTGKRNTLNHAGFGDKVQGSDEIVKDLKGFTAKYFDAVVEELPKLLINLSNHPYATWSQNQRKEAEAYGRCEDLAFPQVCPDMEKEQLEKVVDRYEHLILEHVATAEVTVHIMGEMVFCFALIKRLQSRGIRCIASCSKRKVVQVDGNTRQSAFEFGGFREYFS